MSGTKLATQVMQPDHHFTNEPDDKIAIQGRGGPRCTNSRPERIHIHDKEGRKKMTINLILFIQFLLTHEVRAET